MIAYYYCYCYCVRRSFDRAAGDLPSFSITNMRVSSLNNFIAIASVAIGIVRMNAVNDGATAINGASIRRMEKVALYACCCY